jgi:hypothetical protein
MTDTLTESEETVLRGRASMGRDYEDRRLAMVFATLDARRGRIAAAGAEFVRAADRREELAAAKRATHVPGAGTKEDQDRARSLHAASCQTYYEARADLLVALMTPPGAK